MEQAKNASRPGKKAHGEPLHVLTDRLLRELEAEAKNPQKPVPSSRALQAQVNRQELQAELTQVDRRLDRAAPEWIIFRVTALLTHYWQPEMSQDIAEAVALDWAQALASYPKWAIAAAAEEWRDTEQKRPTPAALVRRCAILTHELNRKRRELGRALA
jgi:hypothetical protein